MRATWESQGVIKYETDPIGPTIKVAHDAMILS